MGTGGFDLTYDNMLAMIMNVRDGDVDEDSTHSKTMVNIIVRDLLAIHANSLTDQDSI